MLGSYNRVNGVYACQHPGIPRTLKRDWGWDGFVAPDFKHAVRDPVAAANAGLDICGLGVTEGRTAEHFTSGASRPSGWTRSSGGPCSPSATPASTPTRSPMTTGGRP